MFEAKGRLEGVEITSIIVTVSSSTYIPPCILEMNDIPFEYAQSHQKNRQDLDTASIAALEISHMNSIDDLRNSKPPPLSYVTLPDRLAKFCPVLVEKAHHRSRAGLLSGWGNRRREGEHKENPPRQFI